MEVRRVLILLGYRQQLRLAKQPADEANARWHPRFGEAIGQHHAWVPGKVAQQKAPAAKRWRQEDVHFVEYLRRVLNQQVTQSLRL